MSIVIVAATQDTIIMVSDCRVSHISETGDFSVIDENFKKITQINSNLGVGFTGDFGMANFIMTTLNQIPKCELDNISFDNAFEIIISMMKSYKANHKINKSSMVLAGFNKNKAEIRHTRTETFFIDSQVVEEECIAYARLTPNLEIEIEFVEFYDSSLTLRENLHLYVRELAKTERTINSNLNEISIKKE